jgi:hypothetical protein
MLRTRWILQCLGSRLLSRRGLVNSEQRTGRFMRSAVSLAMVMTGSLADVAYADESGISYWLPGRFGSLAAVPQVPAGP